MLIWGCILPPDTSWNRIPRSPSRWRGTWWSDLLPLLASSTTPLHPWQLLWLQEGSGQLGFWGWWRMEGFTFSDEFSILGDPIHPLSQKCILLGLLRLNNQVIKQEELAGNKRHVFHIRDQSLHHQLLPHCHLTLLDKPSRRYSALQGELCAFLFVLFSRQPTFQQSNQIHLPAFEGLWWSFVSGSVVSHFPSF